MIQLVYIILCVCVLLVCIDGGFPIDKVVFSWVDDKGVSQSYTDTSEPWILPTVLSSDDHTLEYLVSAGTKRILATAYAMDVKVKTEIIEFDVIDTKSESSSNTCANLIRNTDMSNGYQGYWTTINGGTITNMKETLGTVPGNAIRYTPSIFSNHHGGIRYRSDEHMNTKCLTYDTTYEVSAQLLLLSDLSMYAKCTVNVDCPRIDIMIVDSNNSTIVHLSSQDYTNNEWNNNGLWNTLSTQFTLPSNDVWDGSIQSIQIDILGYHRFTDIVIDHFSIVPIDANAVTTTTSNRNRKNLLRRVR